MPENADKLLVTNRTALAAKYGANGLTRVSAALDGLVEADRGRGIKTAVRFIDDTADMAAVGGAAVTNATDDFGCRQAIDALYRQNRPDYIALVGGPDVLPHFKVSIPGAVDGEKTIDSDLPYACEVAKGRTVTSFIGASDPTALVDLLGRIARHQPRPAKEIIDRPFVISAEAWRKSTEESAYNLFGEAGAKVLLSPPVDGNLDLDALRARFHFINLHGELLSPFFLGEGTGPDKRYPVALDGAWLAGRVPEGAVVAAECCYGAALYDPAVADETRGPIANDYLDAGAVAYLGSTSIAYGPAEGNGAADLMARYFLEAILGGGSSGAALLSARHRFIETEDMENPINTKTLAQFLLLGDPATMPCERVLRFAKSSIGLSIGEIGAELRAERRSNMLAKGMSLAVGAIVSRPKSVQLGEQHLLALRRFFAHYHFEPGKSVVFQPAASRTVATALKVLPGRSFVTVTPEVRKDSPSAARGGRFLVTKFIHDRPVSATLYEER
jgi:hypothetical protein